MEPGRDRSMTLTEEDGAEPHDCRTFLDCNLEIGGHAHRQLGRRMTDIGKHIPRTACGIERFTELRFIRTKSCDRHGSNDSYAMECCQSFRFGRDFAHIETAFRFFSGGVDLHEDAYSIASGLAKSMQCVGEARAVERVEQREAVDGFHLVALQVAYEVPANGTVYMVHFIECFLHPVLANVGNPGRVDCGDRVRSMGLRYGDDGDVLAMSAPLDRRSDSRSRIRDKARDFGKRHSKQSYASRGSDSISRVNSG